MDSRFDRPVPLLAGSILLAYIIVVILSLNSPSLPALSTDLLPAPASPQATPSPQ